MKRLVFSIVVILSLTLVSIAQAVDIQGTFVLVPQKSDDVVQKVESTVSRMNLFIRAFAKEKIIKVAKAHKIVSIAVEGNEISIVADDHALPSAPTDGSILTYNNREGDVLRLRTRLDGNKLEQTFLGDKGSRTNICELSEDGNTLEMRVVIKSDYFDEPMKYKLVYCKTPNLPKIAKAY
jgi:hypothetical protein